MSPEINQYLYRVAQKEVKTPATKKAENYPNSRSWGVNANKRISATGVWRK